MINSERNERDTTNKPRNGQKAMTSVKVFAIFIVGVFILQLLYNRNRAKRMELLQIENRIASKVATHLKYKVQFSLEFDKHCQLCKETSTKKVHLVTNIFPMSVMRGRAKLLRPGTAWNDRTVINKADSKVIIQQRDRELLDVLQMNLNNNYILAIHIVYNDEKIVEHLMNQRLRFTNKLIFHWVQNSNPTYADVMLYISEYLRDQLVVVANQDVYLGKGWEVLDHEKIKERNLMYALTRHGKKERYATALC